MKDFLERVLKQLPGYLGQVLELLSHPKTFIEKKDLDAKNAMEGALVFFGISVFITFVACIPTLPEEQDFLTAITPRATLQLFVLLLSVAALALSWKMVGGKATMRKFFIVTCYLSGFMILVVSLFVLVATGSLRVLDPVEYKQVFSGHGANNFESFGYKVFAVILFTLMLALIIWAFIVWGTYRRLNDLSRFKSAIAFCTYNALNLVVFTVAAFMFVALAPVTEQELAAKRILSELEGVWEDRDRFPTEIEIYQFYSSGNYWHSSLEWFNEGNCKIVTTVGWFGRMSVDGSTLTLTPNEGTREVENSCSGNTSEEISELTPEVYEYRIEKDEDGWRLCLSGRYGELCLTPKKPE
jgi:hypothetical protein